MLSFVEHNKVLLCYISYIYYSSFILCSANVVDSDDITLHNFSITNFISQYGYPVETHKNIQTKDGYLLDMYRIPHGKSNSSKASKEPILLMHGFLGSSENWIVLGPEKSIAFLLADQGYDVWMGNARGNAHARKHVKYDPDKDSIFWQFSWQEIGYYDLPTKIDYIRDKTRKNKIFYVGHSQGTTSYFVMASEKPQYNNRIKLMVALAPVVFMSLMPVPGAQYTTLYQRGVQDFIQRYGYGEIRGSTLDHLCNIMKLTGYCDNLQLPNNAKVYSPELHERLMQTFPAGAATRQFIHYVQGYVTGEFRKFDYGPSMNLENYNALLPPNYNLNEVTSPVALFYAEDDTISPPANVERLSKKLPKVVMKYMVHDFTHNDFIISDQAAEKVYKRAIQILNSY